MCAPSDANGTLATRSNRVGPRAQTATLRRAAAAAAAAEEGTKNKYHSPHGLRRAPHLAEWVCLAAVACVCCCAATQAQLIAPTERQPPKQANKLPPSSSTSPPPLQSSGAQVRGQPRDELAVGQCQYERGEWSECRADGTQERKMRLLDAQQLSPQAAKSHCEPSKTVRRECIIVGCKYARGQWSSACENGVRVRIDTLVSVEPAPGAQRSPKQQAQPQASNTSAAKDGVCKPFRRVTKDCRKACHYMKSAWSECANGVRTRTLTLQIEPQQTIVSATAATQTTTAATTATTTTTTTTTTATTTTTKATRTRQRRQTAPPAAAKVAGEPTKASAAAAAAETLVSMVAPGAHCQRHKLVRRACRAAASGVPMKRVAPVGGADFGAPREVAATPATRTPKARSSLEATTNGTPAPGQVGPKTPPPASGGAADGAANKRARPSPVANNSSSSNGGGGGGSNNNNNNGNNKGARKLAKNTPNLVGEPTKQRRSKQQQQQLQKLSQRPKSVASPGAVATAAPATPPPSPSPPTTQSPPLPVPGPSTARADNKIQPATPAAHNSAVSESSSPGRAMAGGSGGSGGVAPKPRPQVRNGQQQQQQQQRRRRRR